MGSNVKFLVVAVLLAIIIGGLAFEQSVGISRNPLVATTTPPTKTTTTNRRGATASLSDPSPVEFHTLTIVYGRGDPSCFFDGYYGRDVFCPISRGNTTTISTPVVEINNE